MTGIRFALLKNAQFIATIDADHQSDPKDLLDLIRAMENDEQIDLLIGSRFLQKNTIPTSRRFYNKIGNMISYLVTGLYVTDSQSGFKIMTRRFAEKLEIDYNGFEFCIDIIKKAHMNKFKVAEAPVSVIYTKDTMAKGQSFKEGLMMLGRLFNPFT
jgi:glycosyltransferase involved in cell wall biosynthesis